MFVCFALCRHYFCNSVPNVFSHPYNQCWPSDTHTEFCKNGLFKLLCRSLPVFGFKQWLYFSISVLLYWHILSSELSTALTRIVSSNFCFLRTQSCFLLEFDNVFLKSISLLYKYPWFYDTTQGVRSNISFDISFLV